VTTSPSPPRASPDDSSPEPGLQEARARAAARRRAALRRQRLTAAGLIAAVLAVGAFFVLRSGGHPAGVAARSGGSARHGGAQSTPATTPTGGHAATGGRRTRFAVGLAVLNLVDGSRQIHTPSGASVSRTLTTYVRYPATGAASQTDVSGASPATATGPYPLIVFGHGFAVTPHLYAALLQDWARAGYVVAAPVFPLENADAPGGPDESDLVNQPRDMRFVISALLAASARSSGPLGHLIDPREVAVAGQSDGGETALAVAYDRYFRDPRVRAAAILSGAVIPGVGGFTFGSGSPPLLATQGTADTVNPPSATQAFFTAASRPKYLLQLLGASHLPPYSYQQPQLSIVERVTTAFFDLYLKRAPGALRQLLTGGSVAGIASLSADR
jgi:dienelactone hydrolase